MAPDASRLVLVPQFPVAPDAPRERPRLFRVKPASQGQRFPAEERLATRDGRNQCLSLLFLARPIGPLPELVGQHVKIMIVPELIGEQLE